MKKILIYVLAIAILLIAAVAFFGCDINIKIDGGLLSSGNASADDGRVKVGDTVKFGRYEQDGNKSNGKEDVEWLVIEAENGKLLLLSKYVLDASAFSLDEKGCSWNDSMVCDTLCRMYVDMFNYPEKTKINGDISYGQPEYKNGEYVFTLTQDYMNEYYEKNEVKLTQCQATQYALNNGVEAVDDDNPGCVYWWVENTNSNYIYGHLITSRGNGVVPVTEEGFCCGVRPAVWVDEDFSDTKYYSGAVKEDILGEWAVKGGGDKHTVIINQNGQIFFKDGNDSMECSYSCYSDTEIVIEPDNPDLAGFVFILKKDELIRYNEFDPEDVYVYVKA